MQVTASIFKAYDIRGIVGQTLNEAVAVHLVASARPGLARPAAERVASGGMDAVARVDDGDHELVRVAGCRVGEC